MSEKGVVLKSTGSWYVIEKEDLSIIECRMSGKFRLDGLPTTNPIAVGDQVLILPDNEIGKGTIKEIFPEKIMWLDNLPEINMKYIFLPVT